MAWCSESDVTARLSGDVHSAVISSSSEIASSILYLLSGRAITPVREITTCIVIDRNGRASLRDWHPVRDIYGVEINGVKASYNTTPSKSFVLLSPRLSGYSARITLLYGTGVPEFAREAAAALAREFVRVDPGYSGEDKRVDPRLASVSRQGVNWSYRDVTDSLRESLTGVYEVDAFLKAVNPQGARFQSRVVSP